MASIALGLLLALAGTAHGEEGEPPRQLKLRAHALPAAPTIDGDLVEWSGAGPEATARMSERRQGHPKHIDGWEGREDASAAIRVGVHGDHLYLAGQVEDDLPHHDPADSWWHWDSIELFLDADTDASTPPGDAFTPGCWQIFLMPLNPEVAWGVVFHGQETHFDDGGLRGVDIAHRMRTGGYDFEVSIPLAELGITGRDARTMGFALALNDSDEGASTPGTYLSWNEGLDLYRFPKRFGRLELPAREAAPAQAPASSGGWPLWTLLAAVLVLAAAVVLAGIGARRLAGQGPRPKLIALGLIALLAGGLAYENSSSRAAAVEEVRQALAERGADARTVVKDAQAAGALRGGTAAERAAELRLLLSNETIPARPGVEAAAFVPLHEDGAYRDDKRVVYSIPLQAPLRLDLPERPETDRFRPAIERTDLERSEPSGATLGTLRFHASDGTTSSVPVAWPAGAGAGTQELDLTLDSERTWVAVEYEPLRRTRGLTLKGLAYKARDAVSEPGKWTPLALAGRTLQGVPVLAHARGPDHGVRLEPGEQRTFPIPEPLGGSDRLWVLLRPDRAFPDLLGDDVLARLTLAYGVGEPMRPLELRNGEHLSAERQPLGLERPTTVRSRVAFKWSDTLGYRLIREAVPVPLETERRPTSFTVENTSADGLRVVAATVVRTRALPEDSTVSLLTDERESADRIHLRHHGDAFLPYLAPAADAVREMITIGAGDTEVPLRLQAPLPARVEEKQERTTIALLTCLALGLFLLVLLAVDMADRLPMLSRRLGYGVLAAALVPLAVTILFVDRTNVERVTSAATERALSRLGNAESRLDETLRSTQRAARRLAAHLSSGRTTRDSGEIQRLVRLFGGPVLPDGASGSAVVTGAEVSGLHVPLGSRRRGLKGTRYLPASTESGGFHVSPWDGLVVTATARRGSGDRRVNVTLGIGTTDRMLASALGGADDEPGVSAAILDPSGRVLASAGEAGLDLGQAVGRDADAVRAHIVDGEPYVIPQIAGGTRHHLAAVKPLADAGAAQGGGAWLVLGFDRAAVEEELAAGRETLIWLALFGLILIISVAALVARRVSAPVRNLVRATDAVRHGSFDVAVEPTSGDEVGELTIAFDQMRLDLRNRVGDLDFLRRAQDTLSASLDVGETAGAALALFLERTEADEGLVLGAQGAGATVSVLSAKGAAERFGDRPFEPGAAGWIRKSLADPQVRLVHHETDRALVEGEGGPARRLTSELAAWLTVPLWSGRELQGLVVLGWRDAQAVPMRRGQRLLLPLAGVVAAALNNARLYRLAALDDVTRLPGATAFEAALRDDVERAQAGGPRAVLLRVGLDHLEHITLRRGVEDSRTLLRSVAEAMRGIVGERGKLGRLRGEELAVRLPGATPEDARRIAEALRERIAKVEVAPEEAGEPLITTASIGIARAPEDAQSVEFLLDAAGRALSAALREGGDRVEDVARVDQGAVDMPPFEEGAIFRNERMVRVVDAARRAARSDASILITGETGTGKEVIATLVHRRSARSERPFVTVNCAAFPESLLESELFGHERGAFTGAERRREGRFELADGGTLFLDEIAEMAPSAQVKLLRVLQERQFTRLGGTRTITIDVRIIAATNRDLERAVKDGSFREDLYYRLNVIRLELPPLRDRREEIPFLVEKFLADFQRRSGRGPRALTPAAMDVLYRHPWPGNVRELKNTVERCAVLCEADVVGPEHLQFDAMRGSESSSLTPRSAPQDQLNARQRALLEYLARHGRATNRIYYEMTGTSPRTALRDLQDLMERGLIVREGKRRGAVYRLT